MSKRRTQGHARTLGDKLHELARLAPLEIATIETIVSELIHRHKEEDAARFRETLRVIVNAAKMQR